MNERRVAVVGAGLAGLAAAVAAHAAGAGVVVFERDDTPGGATAASAGWIWRYSDARSFRKLAPHGDRSIQDLVVGQLDPGIRWLEAQGVRRVASETGRSFTEGVRVDPAQALDALARRLPDEAICTRCAVQDARRVDDAVELLVQDEPVGSLPASAPRWHAFDAVIFAGGGYAADLARVAVEAGVDPGVRGRWRLRARRAGDGSSMDAALALGAGRMPVTGECFVRLVPADADLPARELSRFGELQAVASALVDEDDRPLPRAGHDWSGSLQAWTLARTTGEGWMHLPRECMREHVASGRVEDVVRVAVAGGARVATHDGGEIAIRVAAGITHTICGLRVDDRARVLAPDEVGRRGKPGLRPLPRLYAAGCDAAGTGAGGYASGLAQALVLGRRAGEDAASH